MKTALHIVTYWRDVPWLPTLLKSIGRHCTGFHEIILCIPNRDRCLLDGFGLTKEKIITFDEQYDGHMAHCYMKLSADEHTDADLICHVDSDCVFKSDCTPNTFIRDGKPMNLYTPFTIADGKEHPSHWRKGSEEALGEKVKYETMRRHGNIYWRDTYRKLRNHIEKVHNKSLFEYLRPFKRGVFSEFCTIGAFAMQHEPMNYSFIYDKDPKCPPSPIHQFWSFHGIQHPDVQAKMKEFGLV